jgi:predicted RNA-binding protein YlqC (UPF0109 family)
MKELIQIIAQAMVDAPEMVSVREVHGGQTTVFELQVAKSDMGKVIGKKGRNVEAMRVILRAVSAKEKKRAILEIVNPNDTKMEINHFQNPRTVKMKKPIVRTANPHNVSSLNVIRIMKP